MNTQKKQSKIIFPLLGILICLMAAFVLFMQSHSENDITNKNSQGVPDTAPPVISCNVKSKTLPLGKSISIESLGVRAADASPIKSLAFTKISSEKFYTGLPEEKVAGMKEAYKKGIAFTGEEFQFSYGGIYELTIEACDRYDNKSEITVTIKVEEPPVMEGVSHFYAALGTEIDFSKYIDVWDFLDEDFDFEKVTVDISQLNIGQKGDYPVTFSATDSYGLKSTATVTVHMLPQKELQTLIDTNQISLATCGITGAYNAYDVGELKGFTPEEREKTLKPAEISILNDTGEVLGTGNLIYINENFVTIAAPKSLAEGNLHPTLVFHEGSTKQGSLVAINESQGIALIRIPIEGATEDTSLSWELVKTLRTLHIDQSYWISLDEEIDPQDLPMEEIIKLYKKTEK